MTDQRTWRLLDLFCGAGGAAEGYRRAGFTDITGVDVKPQPRYPFRFVQADALEYLACFWPRFDVVHASPPCQAFTQMSAKHRGRSLIADGHPDLLAPIRAALAIVAGLFVIENVPGARQHMRPTMTLHGGMFGLGVNRPRLFETNVYMLTYFSQHTVDPIGVYGSHCDRRRLWTRTDGSRLRCASSNKEAGEAMGIDWMTDWRELTEAIPPAYTEFIGRHLLAFLNGE